MAKRSFAKCWCFTLNNPLANERIDPDLYDYLVVGDEVGASGTPHHQGYVVFKKPYYPSGVKKILSRAHWEVAKGSAQQNRVYCTKDGKFVETGFIPPEKTVNATLKRKADYDLAVTLAKQQKVYDVESGILVRHLSNLSAIARDHPPDIADIDDTCGLWLQGPTGVGKSRQARWLYPKAFPKLCNKWWDGYQNELYVIIDDVGTEHRVLGYHFKIWADRYPFTAEKKGTSIRIRPLIICVTSQYSIDEVFGSDFAMCEAIKRRFKVINLE